MLNSKNLCNSLYGFNLVKVLIVVGAEPGHEMAHGADDTHALNSLEASVKTAQ